MKHLGLTETKPWILTARQPPIEIYFNLFPRVSVDILSYVSQLVVEVKFFFNLLSTSVECREPCSCVDAQDAKQERPRSYVPCSELDFSSYNSSSIGNYYTLIK